MPNTILSINKIFDAKNSGMHVLPCIDIQVEQSAEQQSCTPEIGSCQWLPNIRRDLDLYSSVA